MPKTCSLTTCPAPRTPVTVYGDRIDGFCERHARAYSSHFEGNHDGECGGWNARTGCGFC